MVYNLFIHQVGSIGRLSLADIERLAVFSLGRTLSSAASNGLRSVQPLLAAMCSHQLSMVPRLLDVLSEVERHWRQEVGEMRTYVVVYLHFFRWEPALLLSWSPSYVTSPLAGHLLLRPSQPSSTD